MKNLLFITEKIKNNLFLDDLLYGTTYLSKAVTCDDFALSDSGNYFLINNQPKSRIEGCIYSVSDLALIRLDRYHDFTDFSFRMNMPVISEHGETLDAWIYIDDHIEIRKGKIN